MWVVDLHDALAGPEDLQPPTVIRDGFCGEEKKIKVSDRVSASRTKKTIL